MTIGILSRLLTMPSTKYAFGRGRSYIAPRQRIRTKYSCSELRAIRARNGVGRPPAVYRARADVR